jgi:hypothetical protein
MKTFWALAILLTAAATARAADLPAPVLECEIADFRGDQDGRGFLRPFAEGEEVPDWGPSRNLGYFFQAPYPAVRRHVLVLEPNVGSPRKYMDYTDWTPAARLARRDFLESVYGAREAALVTDVRLAMFINTRFPGGARFLFGRARFLNGSERAFAIVQDRALTSCR